jgi:hypothetical protein
MTKKYMRFILMIGLVSIIVIIAYLIYKKFKAKSVEPDSDYEESLMLVAKDRHCCNCGAPLQTNNCPYCQSVFD